MNKIKVNKNITLLAVYFQLTTSELDMVSKLDVRLSIKGVNVPSAGCRIKKFSNHTVQMIAHCSHNLPWIHLIFLQRDEW